MADYDSGLPVRLRDNADTGLTSVTNGSHQALSTTDQANGPVTPGAAAAFSELVGGQYNSTLPTLTTGQQSALQVDASGRLIVSAVVVFPYDTNYGTVDATTLRTASQIGNATGAADFGAGATDAQTLRTTANQGTPNTNANGWPVKVTDGTNDAGVTPASTAATTTEPALVVALSPNTPLPAGTNSIGTVTVSNLPTTLDTNYGVVGASTLRTASEIGNATGAADFNNGATDAQTLRVAANLAVGGANVTLLNPVPVTVTSASSGTPIQNYTDVPSTSFASGSTFVVTYTVPATHTFSFERVWVSGSGKLKAVIANTGTNIFAGFNSTANPNIDITVTAPPSIIAGNTVTVTLTNEDIAAFDAYVTIEGNQIS